MQCSGADCMLYTAGDGKVLTRIKAYTHVYICIHARVHNPTVHADNVHALESKTYWGLNHKVGSVGP